VSDLKELVARFKKLVKDRTGKQFPNDPWAQLQGSIGAVFGSWMNDRAIVYRRKYNIPQEWGTAVNVQAMVFGNTGVNSGSGVAFTRDPATGEKVFYGEFLINAQGEDVVGGVRTPEPVADLKKHLPKALVELERIRHVLEAHFKDVQDFEFTIQTAKFHAANAQRKTHRGGGSEICLRHGPRKIDRMENRDHAGARRSARSGPGAGIRPRRAEEREGDCERTSGRTGRGYRQSLL
jgi:Phosphoenolpyruvate synthase/pyruvate phosphate dikinase